MKAIIYEQYGDANVLRIKEVQRPSPKAGEILLKVHASSVNDFDWGLVSGTPYLLRLSHGLGKPKKFNIPGCDVAGVVEALGDEVEEFQIGDSLFGDLSGEHFGGFAEYVCAPASTLRKIPLGMSFPQAAALPHAGLLALQSLNNHGVQAGQRVLVNGAGGGMGSIAIQLAKSAGAVVTAVDAVEKFDFMSNLGADHLIDYQSEDFTKNGESYDLIIDAKAYHSYFDYRRALAPGGKYSLVGGAMGRIVEVGICGLIFAKLGSKKLELLIHEPNQGLDKLSKLFEEETIVPIIDSTYPLCDAAKAMEYFVKGKAKGKVILTMEIEKTD